ncbi:MAG: MotA/TolQ/ExbB proton channel family protein [Elusimicrobiales bacterium]|nr:MotA/TolQ/ExbB proton channel family protein [Elusimicrobiales bacterium]
MTDIITIIIICVIIICFFYGLLNIGMCDYVFKIHYIRNFLNRIGMQRRTKYRVRKSIKNYKKTFINKKTTLQAEEYFNEERFLVLYGINTKMMRAISGILVGIGVMGTFAGLTAGLNGINLNASAAEMQKSISSLLGGMTTAFLTSLFGMGASIVYTWLEKKRLNSISVEISRFCDKLNKKYYISPEQQFYENNFKIYDEHGRELLYGNVIRGIKENIEKLSSAADNINETVLINITNKAVSENLKPVLYEVQQLSLVLSQKLDDLGSRVEKPGEDMVKTIIGRIEVIMDQFRNNIASSAEEKIKELDEHIKTTGSVLAGIPEHVKNATEGLNRFATESREYSCAQKKNIDEMLQTVKNTVNELNVSTKETVNLIASRNEETNKMTDTIIKSFKENMIEAGMVLQRTSAAINSMNSLKDEFNKISNNLSETAKASESSADMLITAQKDFTETINRTQEYSEEYVKKFGAIENSLQSVFDEMQKSVDNYKDAVCKSMEDLLKGYATHTSTAITSLGNVVGELKDIMEDISEKKK